jgi:anti-sigma28 factor (negative regulator of flagellin synthesis)
VKINDHGFTERVGTAATPASGIGSTTNGRSSANVQKTGTGDDLQLSGFAARLNSDLSAETANRAERVDQISKAVGNSTFQIDTSAVSRSIVSEALTSRS